MSYQAPWRLNGMGRRAADLREQHDARANDPNESEEFRAFRRERLRNSPALAEHADRQVDRGTAVLRDAMSSSDDHEAISHGSTKWDKAWSSKPRSK